MAVLVTSLVSKLELLELSAIADTSNHNSLVNSASKTTHETLWALLATSCRAIGCIPSHWPIKDVAEYQCIREGMHCTMVFLLKLMRSCNTVWHRLLLQLGPACKFQDAHLMLQVPLNYLSSIGMWPASRAVQELDALPSEFITMHCCLMLELLDLLSPYNETTTTFLGTLHSGSLPMSIIMLGRALERVLDNVSIVRPQDTCTAFVTVAMIQLVKRALMICADQPGPYGVGMLELPRNISNLRKFSDMSGSCNMHAAKFASMEEFCAAERGGNQYLPLHQPSHPASNEQLLRGLFDLSPAYTQCLDARYDLAVALLNSWDPDIITLTPFTLPPVLDPARCYYLTAHHCCVQILAWMKALQADKKLQHQRLLDTAPAGNDTLRCWVMFHAQGCRG